MTKQQINLEEYDNDANQCSQIQEKSYKNNNRIITSEKISNSNNQQENNFNKNNNNNNFKEYGKLMREICTASISITSGLLIEFVLQTISLHYVGLLNNPLLTNVLGLCNILIQCCGGYFFNGLNQAFGSFYGRANGKKNQDLINNYFTKGVSLLSFMLILFAVVVLKSDVILVALNQDYIIAQETQGYFVKMLPGLVAYYYFDMYKGYCNALMIYYTPMVVQGVIVGLHVGFTRYFIEKYELLGIVYSQNIANVCGLGLIWGYLRFRKILPSYKFQHLFQNFREFAIDTITMALPNQLDIMCFEINNILLGSLKNVQQFAANVAFVNIATLVFAFPLGIGGSLNYQISNAIGKFDIAKVKQLYAISNMLGLVVGFIAMVIIFVFQKEIAQFYTPDTSLQEIICRLLNIYQIGIIPDFLMSHSMSILNAIGKAQQSIFGVLGAYVFGNSLGYYLGIHQKFGVFGFCAGFVSTFVISAFILLVMMQNIDWNKQVQYIYQQLQIDGDQIQDQDQNQNQKQNDRNNQNIKDLNQSHQNENDGIILDKIE